MKNSQQLLFEMESELEKQSAILKILETLDEEALNSRPHEKAWSALECVAHLNSYAEYYLPVFESTITQAISKGWTSTENFKSTWIGRYSISSILPENRAKKLNSPKQHNHFASARTKNDLLVFDEKLKTLYQLLKEAKSVDLNKAKVAIEIMPILKLRLGDFFPFLILHQSRHLDQAMEAAGQG